MQKDGQAGAYGTVSADRGQDEAESVARDLRRNAALIGVRRVQGRQDARRARRDGGATTDGDCAVRCCRASFIVDTGAFYSTLSRATAIEFGRKIEPWPVTFRLRGVNGDSSASSAIARNFALGGVTIPQASFVVGGSDTGTGRLLVQNILGWRMLNTMCRMACSG
jgi:predicted aspartyl protease